MKEGGRVVVTVRLGWSVVWWGRDRVEWRVWRGEADEGGTKTTKMRRRRKRLGTKRSIRRGRRGKWRNMITPDCNPKCDQTRD
mmetsp:Transcript_20446/g.42652  ORF Transcript_20446/g.42652 Transcript_20446/m.42652 type:complete len:83 (-) Transcript_20446:48-296(-)